MIRYQAGDEAAFEEIYGRYSKKIYGFIMRRLANPDTSADLFQETFLRLHRGEVFTGWKCLSNRGFIRLPTL